MDVEKTLKNLRRRGFQAQYFETGAEAAAYVASQVHDTTVGIGGSKTVDELGLYDLLVRDNTVYWHWKDKAPDIRSKANASAVYLTSANAISENGEILNIDGSGNRLAATSFGKKRVFILAGTNKLAPDFEQALWRARNIAAVKNADRLGKKTPCRIDGKCHDCNSPERICGSLLVSWKPMNGMTTEVILIGEELGY